MEVEKGSNYSIIRGLKDRHIEYVEVDEDDGLFIIRLSFYEVDDVRITKEEKRMIDAEADRLAGQDGDRCVYCGGEVYANTKSTGLGHLYYIYCETCAAQGPSGMTEDQAWAKWRERAS